MDPTPYYQLGGRKRYVTGGRRGDDDGGGHSARGKKFNGTVYVLIQRLMVTYSR
jgi:hypothetical protein